MIRTMNRGLLAATTLVWLAATPVSAEEHATHHVFHDRVVAEFRGHDLDVWRGGTWHHQWLNGRFGWWWFAGGVWYFYDEPIYPYPEIVSEVTYVEPTAAPPPPAVTAAAAAPVYYYCDKPAGYYPYVASCATAFRAVPAAPPSATPPPPTATP